jgi:hypothetical protein
MGQDSLFIEPLIDDCRIAIFEAVGSFGRGQERMFSTVSMGRKWETRGWEWQAQKGSVHCSLIFVEILRRNWGRPTTLTKLLHTYDLGSQDYRDSQNFLNSSSLNSSATPATMWPARLRTTMVIASGSPMELITSRKMPARGQ